MLVLRRNEGQWIEVSHWSGDVLRFRVYGIEGDGRHGRVQLAFDDAPRNFAVHRPERLVPYAEPGFVPRSEPAPPPKGDVK